eukprot:scaffold1373_cov367-Pinguiococcus_pyrenoidosus.AAC.30
MGPELACSRGDDCARRRLQRMVVMGRCGLHSRGWRLAWALLATVLTSQASGPSPVVLLPGGGLFFYWQAGALKWLAKQQALGNVAGSPRYVGASAGALAATLAVSNVDFDEAVERALQLAEAAKIWERPLGLAGVRSQKAAACSCARSACPCSRRLPLLTTPA